MDGGEKRERGGMNGETAQSRDGEGRFHGLRVNVEDVPRLPAYVARYALEDPRARPYLVAWTDQRYGEGERVALALRVEPLEGGRVRFLAPGLRETVETVRVPIPGGRAALLWRCPVCGVPRRFLYLHRLTGWGLFPGRVGCGRCNRLRWSSQGRPLGAFARIMRGGRRRAPFPRSPWDPAAVVSSPAVLEAIAPELSALVLRERPTGRAMRVPTARDLEGVRKAVRRISANLSALEARFRH